MQSTSPPTKIQLPFANAGAKNAIPVASQISTSPGAASFTDGFPPATRTALAAGGVPPSGGDVNGILNAITTIQQWQSAGGLFSFDAAFATAVGGYPKGAILIGADNYTRWINLTEGNTTNPDGATPAGWMRAHGSLAGSDAGYNNIAGAVTIPVSDIGKVIPIGGSSAQTVMLPSTSGLPDGASLTLYCQNPTSGASYTLSAQSGQNIVVSTGFAQTTTLAPGDIVTMSVYAGNWTMTGGATGVSLSRMSGFGASKASSGYQKLPSGLIIQWGNGVSNASGNITFTFPIAFPTMFLTASSITTGGGIVGSIASSGPSNMSVVTYSTTTGAAATGGLYYIAIGY